MDPALIFKAINQCVRSTYVLFSFLGTSFLLPKSSQVEVHLALDKADCKTLAFAEIPLKEAINFPSNKLHGSVMLNSVQTFEEEETKQPPKILGTLDYWFKLHAAGKVKTLQ